MVAKLLRITTGKEHFVHVYELGRGQSTIRTVLLKRNESFSMQMDTAFRFSVFVSKDQLGLSQLPNIAAQGFVLLGGYATDGLVPIKTLHL